jgi:ubiquinone/menaquinone biosynthesis C-methylase UbiE
MTKFKVSENIKAAYDSSYLDISTLWREVGAKNKANNILELCKNIKIINVLEVGSGDGSIIVMLEKEGFNKTIYSLDISDTSINIIKSKNIGILKEVKQFDGYNIPYIDNFFDLVICSHVIEHVEYPRMLLREIKRVSNFQIFEIPIDFSFNVDNKVENFLSYGHINIYYPGLFKFLIKSEGFKILKEKYGFYNKESTKLLFPKKSIKYYFYKFKKFIIKNVCVLRKIKPDIYAVLCSKSEKRLKIF